MRAAAPMVLFALTIFVSAFLLFLVQPLIGKVILPWFGGTPSVWTTCMLFFQVVLLGGYAYAHYSTSRLSLRRQGVVHAILLAVAVAVTAPTILPAGTLRPEGDASPLGWILLVLGLSVGLPYFTLSATGSLVQAWFARAHPHRSPYPLYALSNVGSLLGLLGFPFFIEPLIGTRLQASAWFWGYAAFALMCAALARRIIQTTAGSGSLEPTAQTEDTGLDERPPVLAQKWRWVALGACGSTMLLAITNRMSLDIAAVPFLWVVPLSLYLVSFILCFGGESRYPRWLFFPALVAAEIGAIALMFSGPGTPFLVQVLGWSAILFVLVMVCHGELYRTRPHPRHLTSFYLALSLGGALGGVFVGVIAPLLFTQYLELHIGLLATAVLAFDGFRRDARLEIGSRRLGRWVAGLAIAGATTGVCVVIGWPHLGPVVAVLAVGVGAVVWFGRWLARHLDESHRLPPQLATARAWWLSPVALVALVFVLGMEVRWQSLGAIASSRSFFGMLRVTEHDAEVIDDTERRLYHGAIRHGVQFVAPQRQMWHNAYFGPQSGVGLALRFHPLRDAGNPMHIGVLGLGAGTLLTYGKPGDTIRIYEIDPDVEHMSRRYFTYFDKTQADTEVVIGDGRLSLEREEPQSFDVLILDAFSSDAIPMHLLTREAFATYLTHLAADGILAVNATNRHVDIRPVLVQMAEHFDLRLLWFETWGDDERGVYGSDWVLLTRNEQFAADERVATHADDASQIDPSGLRAWTDDYTNLLAILK